jgi:hypothetical protein
VEVQPYQLVIELAGTKTAKSKRSQHHRNVITLPCQVESSRENLGTKPRTIRQRGTQRSRPR